MINRVILLGTVSGDPKLSYNLNGKPECRLTLVLAEGKGEQTFYLYVPTFVYGTGAERAAEEVDAGDIIAVDGRLGWKSTPKKDGTKLGLCVTTFGVEVLVKGAEGQASDPTPPPALGTIRETVAAMKLAERERDETSRALYDVQQQLEALKAGGPQRVTAAEGVEAFVAARRAFREEVEEQAEIMVELRTILDLQQAQVLAFKADLERQQHRARELREVLIPEAKRRLADTATSLRQRLMDLEAAVHTAQPPWRRTRRRCGRISVSGRGSSETFKRPNHRRTAHGCLRTAG